MSDLTEGLDLGDAELDLVDVGGRRIDSLKTDAEGREVLRSLPERPDLLIGAPQPAPGSCRVHQPLPEVVAAFVEPDEAHPEGQYQVRVRVICAECLVDFEIDLASRRPRDLGPGVVHTMRPAAT